MAPRSAIASSDDLGAIGLIAGVGALCPPVAPSAAGDRLPIVAEEHGTGGLVAPIRAGDPPIAAMLVPDELLPVVAAICGTLSLVVAPFAVLDPVANELHRDQRTGRTRERASAVAVAQELHVRPAERLLERLAARFAEARLVAFRRRVEGRVGEVALGDETARPELGGEIGAPLSGATEPAEDQEDENGWSGGGGRGHRAYASGETARSIPSFADDHGPNTAPKSHGSLCRVEPAAVSHVQ